MTLYKKFVPNYSSPLDVDSPDLIRPITDIPTPTSDDELEYNRIDDDDDESIDTSIPPQFLNQLATFPLFNKAPKSFHSKIANKLKLLNVHPKQYIVKKGDPSTSMYWILKGKVHVTSTDGESIYAELNSGDFFGEIGILYNRPRTATVIANSKTLLAVLTSKTLNSVLKNYPTIERRIRDEAQERLAMQEKSKKKKFLDPLMDHTVSIQSFLTQLPIFGNLPSNIIHQIALQVEPLMLPPFTHVFKKNDQGANIYFIVKGQVEVVDYDSNNQEIKLARLSKFDYFGEINFLNYLNDMAESHKRSASIRSITSIELIVVNSKNLKQLCEKYPFIIDEMKITAKKRINNNKLSNSKSRLSIDYLIDKDKKIKQELENDVKNHDFNRIHQGIEPTAKKKRKLDEHEQPHEIKLFFTQPTVPIASPKPIFSTNWNFDTKELSIRSRSVSPITPYPNSPSPSESRPMLKKRASVYDETSAVPLTLPPLNPPSPSLNNFQNSNYASSNLRNFQYLPLNRRMRLASVSGRRRSSILNHNGFLPDKILIRVFEFLQLPELMKLRIISRRWRQLLNVAPNLFNTLDLTRWNTSIYDKSLIQITDFVGSRPSIIDISNCFHVTDEGFSYMVNEIGMSGKIKVLKMKSNWEINAMAIMDLTAPSVGQHLVELDLSNCRKVRDDVLERLIGWDSDVPQNDPLNLDYDMDQIGCKNLRILNIGYCKHVTDKVMYHLANHANKKLESLDLTRCTSITDKGFQYWGFNSFLNLKKLSLKDCTYLTDKSITTLASAAPNLEILDLNFCCALSDVAIEVLCMRCQNLRELNLSFCGSAVSDSSLLAISLQLRSLEKLIVRGCIRVTRAGVDALLSGCHTLSYIDIGQCKNAHFYPEGTPAQKLDVNPHTKSAFVAGPYQNVIEIVI